MLESGQVQQIHAYPTEDRQRNKQGIRRPKNKYFEEQGDMTKSRTDLLGFLHQVWYHIIQNTKKELECLRKTKFT